MVLTSNCKALSNDFKNAFDKVIHLLSVGGCLYCKFCFEYHFILYTYLINIKNKFLHRISF